MQPAEKYLEDNDVFVEPGPRRTKILAVDDEKNILNMYKRIFIDTGFEIICADSGEKALKEAVNHRPDIILLDVLMPGPNGYDVCCRLKSLESLKETEVIFISAKGELPDKLKGYRRGGSDYLVKPFNAEELLAKLNMILERKRHYINLLSIDPLTQVGNRKLFDEQLDRFFKIAARYHRPLSMALIDIDHFKKVNDGHGHAVGDAVLRELSLRLKKNVRTSDILARIGGEEFCVLMPETDKFEALTIQDRLRASIASVPFRKPEGGLSLNVTVSIGVSAIPDDASSQAGLYRKADEALYRAKENGRNQVVLARTATPSFGRLRLQQLEKTRIGTGDA